MRLLGVKPGLDVADIGAGSGYYTVRVARRVGQQGHVFAEDVVPDYFDRLARRVDSEGLAGSVTLVHGEPHDPRLAPGSLDLALLVHMYHQVAQPYGLLWNLRPALRPGARVAVIDARKQTASHGTPRPLTLRAGRGRLSSDGVLRSPGEHLSRGLRAGGRPGLASRDPPVFGQAELNPQSAARRRSR
jgi:ubiquinone/menaquinone biosynthesis C-methylase UbiE